MKDKNKRKQWIALMITFGALLLLLLIGPFDVCTHGNYIGSTDFISIDNEVLEGQTTYVNEFVSEKRHFTGFGIRSLNIPEEQTGKLTISLMDANGEVLSSEKIAFNEIRDNDWYRIYFHVRLKVGNHYNYLLQLDDCTSIDDASIGVESDRGIFVGQMYAESTFSLIEKSLFGLFITSVWMFCISQLLLDEKRREFINKVVFFFLMIFGLSWNFMYNSLDNQNNNFERFQYDSEALVMGVIYADQKGLEPDSYGLGTCVDLCGVYTPYRVTFVTDDNWICGYSRFYPQILIAKNALSQQAGISGNYIQFPNQEIFQIIFQEESDGNLILTLGADGPLDSNTYGDLLNAVFLDANMNPIKTEVLNAYKSQYGLQGKIFRYMARYISFENTLVILNFLCCLATAFVFAVIVMLIKQKYNLLMASCFFTVFLLSPWIVNFARNLYWVEFTWFLPMAIGLFCSLHIAKKGYRLFCYMATFASVLVKSLCGYEYVSTILLGLIIYLIADCINCLICQNKRQAVLIVRTVFLLGLAALLGFFVAICIHANLRGEGNIVEGIKNIFTQDVLRRTLGGDMNQFDTSLWDSINASIWQTFRQYFHFHTEVIAGITGNLFPAVCILPLIIFGYNYKMQKINWNDVALYGLCFITSVSWFILAKQHSYVHTHMNYVLWYFGYVQICFYVIGKQVVDLFRERKGDL